MKTRFLALVAFVALSLVSHAAELIGYTSGAWWTTKAWSVYDRTAGEISIYIYDNDTVEARLYQDGFLFATAHGRIDWLSSTKGRFTFSFTDQVTFTFTGLLKVNPFDRYEYFGSGIFRSAGGTIKGKWQATWVEWEPTL